MSVNTTLGIRGAARGYVVVTPTSDPPEWNAFSDPARADDFGFVHALVEDIQARLSPAGHDFDATSAILDFFDAPRAASATAGPSPST